VTSARRATGPPTRPTIDGAATLIFGAVFAAHQRSVSLAAVYWRRSGRRRCGLQCGPQGSPPVLGQSPRRFLPRLVFRRQFPESRARSLLPSIYGSDTLGCQPAIAVALNHRCWSAARTKTFRMASGRSIVPKIQQTATKVGDWLLGLRPTSLR
jgi:hypothetical protein